MQRCNCYEHVKQWAYSLQSKCHSGRARNFFCVQHVKVKFLVLQLETQHELHKNFLYVTKETINFKFQYVFNFRFSHETQNALHLYALLSYKYLWIILLFPKSSRLWITRMYVCSYPPLDCKRLFLGKVIDSKHVYQKNTSQMTFLLDFLLLLYITCAAIDCSIWNVYSGKQTDTWQDLQVHTATNNSHYSFLLKILVSKLVDTRSLCLNLNLQEIFSIKL